MNNKAMFWKVNNETKKVNCMLCPHYCKLSEGQVGICKSRKNINNELITLNYGEVSSYSVDPIEKKPLYHFYPGSNILSIGTFGCNMQCAFCQNYLISQKRATTEYLDPKVLIDMLKKIDNNIGVSFTYNEPFMWYEYIYDTSKQIKKELKDKKIVIVTNGYVNIEPLEEIMPYIDAFNIDLKAYSKDYYYKICGAKLEPVLNTIKKASNKCHVEVTTLMVTDENDSIDEIEEIAKFISNINKDIPLHLTRYFPNYKMRKLPTEISKIIKAKQKAEEYLNYVYIGNLSNIDINTYCKNCKQLLINRTGYHTKCYIDDNKCPNCNEKIQIVL